MKLQNFSITPMVLLILLMIVMRISHKIENPPREEILKQAWQQTTVALPLDSLSRSMQRSRSIDFTHYDGTLDFLSKPIGLTHYDTPDFLSKPIDISSQGNTISNNNLIKHSDLYWHTYPLSNNIVIETTSRQIKKYNK